MKTAFIRDDCKFEPEPDVHYTGPDGRARLMRPWAVYQLHKSGHWLRQGTRFYAPRTPKKDIR
jgi:hypothetical protein